MTQLSGGCCNEVPGPGQCLLSVLERRTRRVGGRLACSFCKTLPSCSTTCKPAGLAARPEGGQAPWQAKAPSQRLFFVGGWLQLNTRGCNALHKTWVQ